MISLVWDDLASVVSALIVDRPNLAPRLALAPRRVVHALAAYIHHALEAQHDTAWIAREIERQDVRVLLSFAVANLHPQLYRMLDRLGPTALDKTIYERLNHALHSPAADLLLTVDQIADNHLNAVTQIIADPVLLAARKAIDWSPTNLRNLQLTLAYLRAKKLSCDIETLPPNSGWKAILRRISSDLGRARAPKTTFAAPEGWRHVEDVAALWQVGRTLGNCVSSFRSGGEGYVEQLIDGDAVYLAHDEAPVMLACIRKVGPNLWTLAETTTSRRGSDIMTAREVLRAELTKAIAATGGALLDQSPLSAMRSIAWHVEEGAEDLDLEDVAEDI